MESETQYISTFPRGLLGWAGHQSGGVKRLFDPDSGRPGKELLRTRLISQLEVWAASVASGVSGVPRILLLVGGPGNGKTEAIEHTIKSLDAGLQAEGRLEKKLAESFRPAPGNPPVARIIRVEAGDFASIKRPLDLSIVQDASATAGHEGKAASELLVQELLELLDEGSKRYYLCCVNRGVLDDALIYAIDHNLSKPRALLERISRAVSLSSDAPKCWPLKGFDDIAVWPMDAESLFTIPESGKPPPAAVLLEYVTDPKLWAAEDSCPAGVSCPFCKSRAVLRRAENRTALLQILRWYELASGKRWSFRDLFSLVSYLLSGGIPTGRGQAGDPCSLAAQLVELDRSRVQAREPQRRQLTAVFELVSAGYQQALFHRWDPKASNVVRQGIKDLALDRSADATRTLLGLQHFLSDRKDSYLPATIASLLEDLVDLLDPAIASPNTEVAVSSRTKILLADLDSRFSRSIGGGLEFVKKYHALPKAEIDLLQRLASVDEVLSSSTTRRRNPASAGRLQNVIRDFACRLVRRSLGARSATVADVQTLEAFQKVVEDDAAGNQLYDLAKQVKGLLNQRGGFEVSLTTTFGQPLPPLQRQATLVVPTRQVKPLPISTEGRPASPICFLQVGSGQSGKAIALTYQLFKAVKDLERGLSPASLPRAVVALLDTTKARLSGPIVRDEEVLEDSTIRIGIEGTEIGMAQGEFISTQRGSAI